MQHHADMPDEQLIQFYLNGNPKAMATLAELYKDRIYSAIYSMVHEKYAAEDIFKQVFTVIINSLIAGKTAEEGSFLQWALKISHQLCIEYARKTKTAMVIEMHRPDNIETAPVIFPVSPFYGGNGFYENHNQIKNMISLLPEQQREVVALNHYAGLSFKEIAGIMKCSLSTALDIMQLGLTNLRKQMTADKIAI
jgi:RNA polymerase sigma-70 factor (ECF subfamily)